MNRVTTSATCTLMYCVIGFSNYNYRYLPAGKWVQAKTFDDIEDGLKNTHGLVELKSNFIRDNIYTCFLYGHYQLFCVWFRSKDEALNWANTVIQEIKKINGKSIS